MEAEPSTSGRPDGRAAAQLRALSCARGVLARADGSARWASGGTAVLAAVHGPVVGAPGPGRGNAERAVVEVVLRPVAGRPGAADRLAESLVRQAAAGALAAGALPRAVVQIVLQVLSDDGGLLAAAVNAAGAALEDAGVPMACQLAALEVALAADGALILDPDAREAAAARVAGCFTFASTALAAAAPGGAPPPALAARLAGDAAPAEVAEMHAAAAAGAERVAAFLRLSAERDFAPLFAA